MESTPTNEPKIQGLPPQTESEPEINISSPAVASRVSKIADRPHHLTLALSVVAIVVSLGSFWQSREAYKLATGVSRAAVQVSSAKLVNKPEDSAWLRYDLVLTNFGQVTARNVITSSEFDISQFDVPIMGSLYEHPRAADMAPKFSQTIRLQSNRRFSGHSDELVKGNKNKLLIFGITEYTDDITNIKSKDYWCFVYDPRDEDQSRTLELRRCEYQPSP